MDKINCNGLKIILDQLNIILLFIREPGSGSAFRIRIQYGSRSEKTAAHSYLLVHNPFERGHPHFRLSQKGLQ